MARQMIKHAGMLEPQSSAVPSFSDLATTELQWRAWVQRETRNR